jgi:diguanylate cyclase (GGDEF)-like protein/PAS domain S-box-containing protein
VEALLGKTDADMHLDAQELERIRQEDRQVIDTGTELVIPERHIKDAHGRNRYFSVVKRLLTLPDDTADQVLVVGADITARKEAEEALRESEERIRQISDNLPNGIIYQLRQASDGTCTFSYMSDTVKHLTGYTAEQVIANAALVLDSHHPDDQESYLAAVTESVRTLKPLECELRQYVADGSLRWRQFYATPRCEPDGTIIWDGICIDITERKQLEHQLDQANMLLQEQAIRDPLTGLHNRRYLDETLPRELQRAERAGQPVGIIMLDIDHFKRFNDTYGHDAGDTVLRAVGAFLKEHTRGADIACRYGGEEFTLVLPGASLADTQQRAEELRAGIQTLAVQHGEQPLAQVTISLGVAVFPAHGTTAESLIRAADQALYQAKRNGRNRIEVVTILHSEA